MQIIELHNILSDQFKEAGIDSFHLDAEIIISHVLNIDRYKLTVYPDKILSEEEIENIKKLAARRLEFEPVAYIVGQKEFYSITFTVDKNVLIPRPETELLVDMAIYYAPQNGNVLDLGTGSGAIAISLKHNRKDLNLSASDISKEALEIAEKNSLDILGEDEIDFFYGSLFKPFTSEKFDLIVSNPPYLDREISDTLQKELQHEPLHALYSDHNGREISQLIISEACSFLKEEGILILEIGHDMKEFITQKGKKCGFSVSILNDYSGLSRVAVLKNS